MAKEPEHDNDVYMAIVKHWKEFFQPPTTRYLVETTPLASTSSIYYCLKRLQKNGHIKIIKSKPILPEIQIAIDRVEIP